MEYLSSVRAYPDLDEPRLHYAQYLRSKGDPRGEFIEVQCKLARCGNSTPASRELRKRQHDLYNTFGDSWLDELGLKRHEATFIRGFVEKVTLTPERLLELHTTLSQSAMIRTLRICNPDQDAYDALLFDQQVNVYWTRLWEPDQPSQPKQIIPLIELLSLPLLNDIESLVLSELVDFRYGLPDPPRVGTALAQARNLKNLRKLNLAGVSISVDDAYELCTAQHFNTLQVLDLRESFLDEPSTEAFMIHANFPALHTLMFGENVITPYAITTMLQSKSFSGLVKLDLSGNMETIHEQSECGCGQAMLALANERSALRKLRTLKLSNRCIDSTVATALSDAKLMQQLTQLQLDNCSLSDSALLQLLQSKKFTLLRDLSLADNQLTALSGATLAQQTQWTKLKTLNLSRNALTNQGLIALAKAPYMQHIESLELAANDLTDQGILGFTEANPMRLQTLGLSVNQLSIESVRVLLTRLNSPMLHTLELSQNVIASTDAKLLVQEPCKLSSLYHLDLAFNNLAKPIEFPISVPEIDLAYNQFNDQDNDELYLEDGRTAYDDGARGWSVFESMVVCLHARCAHTGGFG